MSIVSLVSGGMDSAVMAVLIKETGIEQYPLFVDYGQICRDAELGACIYTMKKQNLPEPKVADLGGFGNIVPSGLTNSDLRINEDAFLPGRNLLFLVIGAAYAYACNAMAVAIGLLNEKCSVFPDQTEQFIKSANSLIKECTGRDIKILTPLMRFSKTDIIKLAKERNIDGTYSCHAGKSKPCGKCISCLEIEFAKRYH